MRHVLCLITLISTLVLCVSACVSQPGLSNLNPSSPNTSPFNTSQIHWMFQDDTWQASATPPACPSPLTLQSPTDLSLATAVLYPGQTRGGDYKAHGGLRFNGQANEAITVRAPMDAMVYTASRYIEQGEVQHLFVFINSCGIMYRFDHLLTLSPAMQAIADTLPEPKLNDSTTTPIFPPVMVKTGDTIATAVGFKNTSNVSFDFGVYDLRQKNAASQNSGYAQSHSAEQAQYAVCWFDLLPAADATRVKSLPAGDGINGATSDYCH